MSSPPPRQFPSPRAAAVLGVLLATTGCAKRVALTEQNRGRIADAPAVVSFYEHGALGTTIVRADVNTSSFGAGMGMAGILVGAVIGTAVESAIVSSRQSAADDAAWPVRDGLLGYDPGATLSGALTRELGPLGWLKGRPVEILPLASTPRSRPVPQMLKSRRASSMLLIEVDHMLTPTFDGMAVGADVALYSTQASNKSEPVAVYSNSLWAFVTLEEEQPRIPPHGANEPKLSMEEAADVWSKNGGEKARQALDLCFTELARMIAYDLQRGELRQERGQRRVELTDLRGYPQAGVVELREGRRFWVRLDGGVLYSMGRLP